MSTPDLPESPSVAALPPRHRAFVREMVLNGWNQTKAAEKAGYKPGRGAEQAGWRLSKQVEIAQALRDEQERLAKRYELSLDALDAELHRLAHFDPRDCFDKEGKLLPVHQMPEDARRALQGFEIEERVVGDSDDPLTLRTKKVRWHNKREAIELGLKRLGGLVDRHEIDVPRSISIVIGGVRRETAAAAPGQEQPPTPTSKPPEAP